MTMISFALRRLGFAALVMAGAGVVVALLLSFIPDASLQLSTWERFVRNVHTLLTFDYGMAKAERFPITTVLWHRTANSLILIVGAVSIMSTVGVSLAVGGALRPESRPMQRTIRVVHALSSVPILVWAFVLLIGAGALFGIYPNASNLSTAGTLEAVLIYAVPIAVLVLGDGMLSDIIRNVRNETETELGQTYVRALRARSVSTTPHLFRGILAPVVSAIANKITYLISGTVVVEYVFSFPGLAYQIYESIMAVQDYPLVLAATMIFVGIIVLLDLLGDVATLSTDPRIRTREA